MRLRQKNNNLKYFNKQIVKPEIVIPVSSLERLPSTSKKILNNNRNNGSFNSKLNFYKACYLSLNPAVLFLLNSCSQ